MNPVLALAVLMVALAGCKPRDSALAQGAPAADPSAANATGGQPPVVTSTEPIVIPQSDDMNATLAQLSAQLRSYVGATRSKPVDFQDFVARAHVQVPAPPAGKDYAIVHGQVVLVNR
jgi:hypothetical protein